MGLLGGSHETQAKHLEHTQHTVNMQHNFIISMSVFWQSFSLLGFGLGYKTVSLASEFTFNPNLQNSPGHTGHA